MDLKVRLQGAIAMACVRRARAGCGRRESVRDGVAQVRNALRLCGFGKTDVNSGGLRGGEFGGRLTDGAVFPYRADARPRCAAMAHSLPWGYHFDGRDADGEWSGSRRRVR